MVSLVGFWVIFYGLQALFWEFLPQPAESAGSLSFETEAAFDTWVGARLSLGLNVAAISLVLVAAVFAYLCLRAW